MIINNIVNNVDVTDPDLYPEKHIHCIIHMYVSTLVNRACEKTLCCTVAEVQLSQSFRSATDEVELIYKHAAQLD